MRQLLRMEFTRALKSKMMFLSLCIGTAIALWQFIGHVLPLAGNVYLEKSDYPLTVFEHWMGGENYTIHAPLYFLIVPLLCSLVFLATAFSDRHSGYVKNIFTRTYKGKFNLAKFIVTFVTGGTVAVIPLIMNFALSVLILPTTIPQVGLGVYPIFHGYLMSELFYASPFLYIFVYMVVDFVFCGLLTTLGLVFSLFVENVFVVTLSPFIVYLFTYGTTLLCNIHEYCPYAFLQPSQPVSTTWGILAFEIMIMLVAGGGYLYAAKKKETY